LFHSYLRYVAKCIPNLNAWELFSNILLALFYVLQGSVPDKPLRGFYIWVEIFIFVIMILPQGLPFRQHRNREREIESERERENKQKTSHSEHRVILIVMEVIQFNNLVVRSTRTLN
jgi:hypothetical protein